LPHSLVVMDQQSRIDLISRYQRFIEISLDLASTLDLMTLLNRIIEVAAELSDAHTASIILYDEIKRSLYFQASTDMDENTTRGIDIPLEGSIAGWVVTNRKPVIIDDARADSRHMSTFEDITHYPTQTLLGVPLIAKDKDIGVLEVINKRKGSFTESDQEILLVLAAQAAVAIQNSRLFQQSDLISELVHEIRTPLSSMNTASYILQKSDVSEKQRVKLANAIQMETIRLNEMISSFLDLARLESGRVTFVMTTFDLNLLIRECLTVFQDRAEEKQIKLDYQTPTLDIPTRADRDKIKQVILNLLSNAIKYTPPGGSVILNAAKANNEVKISVTDSGIGIPEEALGHLFEKFYRVKSAEGIAPGTGLGLSISKKIVEGHNGRIEVQSKMGEGTTFLISLPQGG